MPNRIETPELVVRAHAAQTLSEYGSLHMYANITPNTKELPSMTTQEISDPRGGYNEMFRDTVGVWTVYTRAERPPCRTVPDRSVMIDLAEEAILVCDGSGDLSYAPFSAIVAALRLAGFSISEPEAPHANPSIHSAQGV